MVCDSHNTPEEKPAPKDEPIPESKDEKSPEKDGVDSANATMKKFLEKSEE